MHFHHLGYRAYHFQFFFLFKIWLSRCWGKAVELLVSTTKRFRKMCNGNDICELTEIGSFFVCFCFFNFWRWVVEYVVRGRSGCFFGHHFISRHILSTSFRGGLCYFLSVSCVYGFVVKYWWVAEINFQLLIERDCERDLLFFFI